MIRKTLSAVLLGVAVTLPATAGAQDHSMDPIFEVTSANGPRDVSCFERAGHDRHPIARGLSSTAGQSVIGGLIGAAIGNQIGSGSGRDIATGVGAAIGSGIGAQRAQAQSEARVRECQRRSASGHVDRSHRVRY